jgi:hypothetical protein
LYKALYRLAVYRKTFFQFLQHIHSLHGFERGVIDIAGGEAGSFISIKLQKFRDI